jgi:hypothetical protein
MSKSTPIYRSVLKVENDLELYEQFVYLHCVSRFLSGHIPKMPRKQLLLLLALYLKDGYSKETKAKAMQVLNLESANILNSFNFELSSFGFLVPDMVSSHTKHLNKSLTTIRDYIKRNLNKDAHCDFLFSLKLKD